MNRILLILFTLIYKISPAQFTSGNVYVNSSNCPLEIYGEYYDSTTYSPLSFNYDSTLLAYKFFVPLSVDSSKICVYSSVCLCDTVCTKLYGIQNLIVNISICTTVKIYETIGQGPSFYPNPFYDFMEIRSKGENQLLVLDSYGLTIDFLKFTDVINYSNLNINSGIYYFLISNNNQKYNYKVVKLDN